MENIKDLFYIILEMSLAIFLIIFGYAIWDNFDLQQYKTAKYNDAINQV